jgi:hypothetical protein
MNYKRSPFINWTTVGIGIPKVETLDGIDCLHLVQIVVTVILGLLQYKMHNAHLRQSSIYVIYKLVIHTYIQANEITTVNVNADVREYV